MYVGYVLFHKTRKLFAGDCPFIEVVDDYYYRSINPDAIIYNQEYNGESPVESETT